MQPNRNTIPGTESYPAEKGRRMSESVLSLSDYNDELNGCLETARERISPLYALPVDDEDDDEEDYDEEDEDEEEDEDDELDDDEDDFEDEEDDDLEEE
jgi:hypothetical protein